MSLFTWCNAVLIIEYLALACIFVLVICILGTLAQAVSIESIGHSTGQGLHSFHFGGSLIKVMILPANLYHGSDFTILQNGTVWTRVSGGQP